MKLMLIVQLSQGLRGGIIAPILTLFMRKQGFSITQIGLLGTAGMLGWLVFEPITGLIADKVKKKQLIAFSILFSTIVVLGFPVSTAFWQFAVLMFSRSSTGSLYAVSVKSIIAELLPPTARGQTYGRYMAIVSMGAIAGPFIGGYLTSLMGYMMPFYAFAVISVLSLSSTLPLKYDGRPSDRTTAAGTSKDTKLLTRGFLGILTIRSLYMSNLVLRSNFLPVFLYENPGFKATETEIGIYMSITQLTAALSQALLGTITDKIGTKTMIAASLALEGAGYLTLTLTSGIPSLYILGAVHGTASAAADLSMMIHLIETMPKGRTSIVMGLYSEAENIGGIILSPILGTTYDTMGPIFAVSTVSYVLIVVSVLSTFLLQKTPGSKEQPA